MCELTSSDRSGRRNECGMSHKIVSSPMTTIRRMEKRHPYIIYASKSFLVGTFLSAMAVSFTFGNLAHVWIARSHHFESRDSGTASVNKGMPVPTLPAGKAAPHNIYTAKQFHVNGANAKSSNMLLSLEGTTTPVDVQLDDFSSDHQEDDDEEDLFLPSGQHLLVDIKHVNAEFLNDEQRLAEAMVNMISASGLTMLSYHCHALAPMGVSCAGVLLESHVTFHTWPIPGVITLDLFTCGSSPLIPLLDSIKRLFGVPQNNSAEVVPVEPHMQWSHKRRGFREGAYGIPAPDDDLNTDLYGNMDLDKMMVAEVETDFQKITIYDVFDRFHSREDSLASLDKSTYWGQHPELAKPDRRVFLDSTLQSTRHGDAAYHEALVHPTLMTHPNPRRVAILGGGEGATLREVLKHDTIDEVVMIEIDGEMVEACREHLPEWNDCSMIKGSSKNCFDNPRTTLYVEDAVHWFVSRYSGNETSSINPDTLFDVIIMDVLDPETSVEFSDIIYNNEALASALSNALGQNGILVLQQGKADDVGEAHDSMISDSNAATFTNLLIKFGAESQHEYSEGHAGFGAPWSFFVSMKNDEYRTRFMTLNQAEIDLEILHRMKHSVTGEPLLRYFDGASMMAYQFPGRLAEEVYCSQNPRPWSCDETRLDPEIPNISRPNFEVKQSTVNTAGRGVFTKRDIPKGSYIAMEHSSHSMFVPPSTLALLNHTNDELDDQHPYIYCLNEGYVDGYGWVYDYFGKSAAGVDPGIFTFVNHGCDGTYNAGMATEKDEARISGKELFEFMDDNRDIFDPVSDRKFPSTDAYTVLRDIKAGEELLDNYLVFYEYDEIEELKEICSGKLGTVSQYEMSRK